MANLTLAGEHLLEVLRNRVDRGGARIHLLVPATPPVEGWHSHDEGSDHEAAAARLQSCRERFDGLGAVELTDQIGTARVVDAIGDALRDAGDDPYDEIILSTLPAGPSRWIAMDLPARVARAHEVPVTHVEAPALPRVQRSRRSRPKERPPVDDVVGEVPSPTKVVTMHGVERNPWRTPIHVPPVQSAPARPTAWRTSFRDVLAAVSGTADSVVPAPEVEEPASPPSPEVPPHASLPAAESIVADSAVPAGDLPSPRVAEALELLRSADGQLYPTSLSWVPDNQFPTSICGAGDRNVVLSPSEFLDLLRFTGVSASNSPEVLAFAQQHQVPLR